MRGRMKLKHPASVRLTEAGAKGYLQTAMMRRAASGGPAAAVRIRGAGRASERSASGRSPTDFLRFPMSYFGHMPWALSSFSKLSRVIRMPPVYLASGGSTPSLIHLYMASVVS